MTLLARLSLRRRRWWYRKLSTNLGAYSGSRIVGPVHSVGDGRIIAEGAMLGYLPSPFATDRCVYLEARTLDSTISIGSGSRINNACTLISEGPGIWIGRDVLFGPEVVVFDSDFHHLAPERRLSGPAGMAPVTIGDNVFVGARSTILKGSNVGDNTVIAAGSVVVGDIPADVIAGGNPCKVIGPL